MQRVHQSNFVLCCCLLGFCCSSRVLLQVSTSTVARAPSLSCLSRPCVRFMFLPWALASHFGMLYCSSGSKVFCMSYGVLNLHLWLLLWTWTSRRTCNNVMSRVFADGRQGGCQRLDMDMASGLISIMQHTCAHTHIPTLPCTPGT